LLFSLGKSYPNLVDWANFFVLAITFVFIPFLLFVWAKQSLNSGLASVFAATTPIAKAVMVGLVLRVERILRGQVLGLLLGIVGVVLIASPGTFVVANTYWPQVPYFSPQRATVSALALATHAKVSQPDRPRRC
jgi:drug/metabolite transporter (DMT)-like permease